MWRSRGRIPFGVEATASLSSALASNRRLPPLERRLALSMALVRFVNGLADPRQKRVHAMPVSQIATRLGLTHLMVDIRHASTHNQLPSLATLEKSAREAKVWLLANYWEPQTERLQVRAAAALTTLKRYRNAASAALKKSAKTKKRKRACSGAEGRAEARGAAEELMNQLDQGSSFSSIRSFIIPALVCQNLMVRPPKSNPDLTDAILATVFSRLQTVWNPVIERLHSRWRHFLLSLVVYMTDKLCTGGKDPKHSEWHTALLSRWICHFLEMLSREHHLHSSVVRLVLSRSHDFGQSNWIKAVHSTAETLCDKKVSNSNATEPNHSTQSYAAAWSLADNWEPSPIGCLPNSEDFELWNIDEICSTPIIATVDVVDEQKSQTELNSQVAPTHPKDLSEQKIAEMQASIMLF
eukprot:144741_1